MFFTWFLLVAFCSLSFLFIRLLIGSYMCAFASSQKERRKKSNQNVLLDRKIWDNKAAVIATKRDNLIYEFNRKYAPVEANVNKN